MERPVKLDMNKDECKQLNQTYNETILFNNNPAVPIWHCGKQQVASTNQGHAYTRFAKYSEVGKR